MKQTRTILPSVVTYGAYPLTLLTCIGVCAYAIQHQLDYTSVHGRLVMGILLFYVVLEQLFPLNKQWGMTRRFFPRDLKYIVMNGIVESLGRVAVGWLAIKLSLGHAGLMREVPTIMALPVAFLLFEFLQYWFHRWSHELGGKLGSFLWKVHAAHHLPSGVYVVMHVVGHPLNLVIINMFMMGLLPYLLGYSPEVVFLFSVFVNLQGIVAHLNVDIRAGWLNYVLSGTELHRFHHSTNFPEAKNYGVFLVLFDQIFGTFVYRPGKLPTALGVAEPEQYPKSGELFRILMLPFVSDRVRTNLN